MISFLLHGGKTSRDHQKNNAFFAEMSRLVEKEEVKILLCYFSRPRENWNNLRERDFPKMRDVAGKTVTFEVAQDSQDLFKKLQHCDVLYVAGGDAERIEPYYAELSTLGDHLQGKVYAGSSMGAFMASESYVLSLNDRQDTSSVHQGLGLIPLQILCHWDVETEKASKLALLQEYSRIPTLVLNEMEFVTLYKN